MLYLYPSQTVVQLVASAGDVEVFKMVNGAGQLLTKEIFGRCEEAIASGGFSSTSPVVQIKHGSTVLASFTTAAGSAAAMAIGDQSGVTLAAAPVTDAEQFAAGDTLTVRLNTQGAGGTTTGKIRYYLPIDQNLG